MDSIFRRLVSALKTMFCSTKEKSLNTSDFRSNGMNYENKSFTEFKQMIDECNQTIQNYSDKRSAFFKKRIKNFDEKTLNDYIERETITNPLECEIKLNETELFIDKINQRISIELNFYEMNSLTINVNQLFDCSAKVHFRNESFGSNSTNIANCFNYFEAIKSIYSNNDFGICFGFFATNYSIYVKGNDYIKLKVKDSAQNSLLMNTYQEMNRKFVSFISAKKSFLGLRKSLKLYFDNYFVLYFFIDPKTRYITHDRNTALKTTKSSFNAELKITKTFVKLLSKPYMENCFNYGKFI